MDLQGAKLYNVRMSEDFYGRKFIKATRSYATYEENVPAPIFRRRFECKKVQKTTVLICGLGFYRIFINGSEYEASFKFASWVAGSEGQKILAKGNTIVPNQSSVAFSDEYLNPADRKFNNAWAAAYAGENSDIGDWAYFNEGSWVTRWANVLNNNVRFGKMTLSTFFAQCKVTANTDLAKMDLRLYRR